MHEVVTLGETMALICPSDPISLTQATHLTLAIAGAESNLAILLSRFGHRVRFISRVGNDALGQRIRNVLTEEGIDLADLATDTTAPTGVFFREWLPDGQRRVSYYRAGSAASRLAPEDLHPATFSGIRLLHVTGITPALSPSCAATVARAIELAQAAGAWVSFDPNYRAALWDTTTARAALLPLMQQADILLIGHEDSLALLGVADEASVQNACRILGTKLVVLKQGERGACAWDDKNGVSAPAEPVATPIDPVGAGDAFNAGFLAGWLEHKTLAEALALGLRCGAATVATTGDYLSQAQFAQLFPCAKLT